MKSLHSHFHSMSGPFLIVLVCIGLVGCQVRPIGLSAQAGSSILIPLQGGSRNVGFGGTATGEDYQRGTLFFELGGPEGFELTTRATNAVQPLDATDLASNGGSNFFVPTTQVAVLVDIPEDAPLGTHDLHVVRRRLEDGVWVDLSAPTYEGQIQILPPSIDVDLADGGVETIDGRGTPLQGFRCIPFPYGSGCSWSSFSLATATPRPEITLNVIPLPAAAEVELSYPTEIIDIKDCYQATSNLVAANDRGVVWCDDDAANGIIRVSGAVSTDSVGLFNLSLPFELDDGEAAILKDTDLEVTVINAWDSNGALITGATASTFVPN